MTLLYLNADTMGRGDEALGRKLLVAYLKELAASEHKVDLIGCANGAVRLTTEEGPALEALQALEAGGARIASCGTCLDHFGVRENLKIGEVGKMSDTVALMATAERVIHPC